MDAAPGVPLPRPALAKVALTVGAATSLVVPRMSGAAALAMGAASALLLGNPVASQTQRWVHRTLPLAVMGLGAEMDLRVVARTGLQGLGYTAVSLASVFLLGTWLARRLRVDPTSGLLITVGTAICGGSAIAAMAPVLRARDHEISVALATVFFLNAIALVVFPPLGHAAHLGQQAFGFWAALAIHDTSSVVGAGLAYGPQALAIATTIKLARALWIVPTTMLAAWLVQRRSQGSAQDRRPQDGHCGRGAAAGTAGAGARARTGPGINPGPRGAPRQPSRCQHASRPGLSARTSRRPEPGPERGGAALARGAAAGQEHQFSQAVLAAGRWLRAAAGQQAVPGAAAPLNGEGHNRPKAPPPPACLKPPGAP